MKATIEALIREAGALALSRFGDGAALTVEAKGPFDLVTEADRAVEALIVRRLAETFPEDGLFGEEGTASTGSSGRTWVVDPIDGTFNFVRGSPDWSVSIGLHTARGPAFGALYAPVRDSLLIGGPEIGASLDGRSLTPLRPLDPAIGAVGLGFHPAIATHERIALIRSVLDDADLVLRQTGSATVSLHAVASGYTDGYIGMGDSSWDVLAGLAILEGLGGTSTIAWSDFRLTDKLFFACGSPQLVERVRSFVNGTGERRSIRIPTDDPTEPPQAFEV